MNRTTAAVLAAALMIAALAYARATGAPLTPPIARQIVTAVNDGAAFVFGEGSHTAVAMREVTGRISPECSLLPEEVEHRRTSERARFRRLQTDVAKLIDSAIALLPEVFTALDVARELFSDPVEAVQQAKDLVAAWQSCPGPRREVA